MAREEKSMNAPPKRGDVLKGIILPNYKKREQNVCECEFAQNALVNVEEATSSTTARNIVAPIPVVKELAPGSQLGEAAVNQGSVAVASSSATPSLVPANFFREDAPLPTTKNEAMAKHSQWPKVFKNRFLSSNKKEEHKPEQKQLSLQQSSAAIPEREFAQYSPVLVGNSWATSTDAANFFLENAPYPTRNEAMAKIWAKVDLNNALLHEGSALYQDENGKWAVIGPLCEEPGESEVQLRMPVPRIATPWTDAIVFCAYCKIDVKRTTRKYYGAL